MRRGMTAVDAAVQSKFPTAEGVTMVYRRGRERTSTSGYELDHAASKAVRIITDAKPVRVTGGGAVREVESPIRSRCRFISSTALWNGRVPPSKHRGLRQIQARPDPGPLRRAADDRDVGLRRQIHQQLDEDGILRPSAVLRGRGS